MKLLIATRNPAKFEEISRYLGQGFELISLADSWDLPEIEVKETGKTFRANALLKAHGYFRYYQIPTLADDGGLEISVFHGRPGVQSRRWPGHEATDQELIDLTLKLLAEVPWEQRRARLTTVGAFVDGTNEWTQSSWVDGYIVESQTEQCQPGYPFRSIFWIPQFNKLFSQLTKEEHDIVNHRKKVYEALAVRIRGLAE